MATNPRDELESDLVGYAEGMKPNSMVGSRFNVPGSRTEFGSLDFEH
jgi:hypothetical protein